MAGAGAGGMASVDVCAVEEADYYVAVDGSDSNPGTIDQPFATLQQAIDLAEPGELVYVRGGIYEIVNPAIRSAGIVFLGPRIDPVR